MREAVSLRPAEGLVQALLAIVPHVQWGTRRASDSAFFTKKEMDPALQGSLATGLLGVVSLVIARVRCLYKRDEEGHCGPCVCGCTEKSIQPDHEEVECREVEIGDTKGILLLPKK